MTNTFKLSALALAFFALNGCADKDKETVAELAKEKVQEKVEKTIGEMKDTVKQSDVVKDVNATMDSTKASMADKGTHYFNRVASFAVCTQIDPTCNTNIETSAEIVSATADGNTLVYTDSPNNNIGLVDISNPKQPVKKGTFNVGGEPTSVYVKGKYALVGVNTSQSYTEPSGTLQIIDISGEPKRIGSIYLGGQPDSVAISKDGKFAAVAIENERNEDIEVNGEEGALPQLPAGKLVIVDIASDDPIDWEERDVDLTGLDGMLFNNDPEPEYVDFNDNNEILVTMQENNHIAIVDATTGKVTNHFTAGTVTLKDVDTKSNKPRGISLTNTLNNVPREPDGATWIDNNHFATADEGDWNGGGRGFTVFNKNGSVVYEAGNTLEHEAVRLGHYPDKRAKKKGNEPENAEFGIYDGKPMLFIASERASLIFVYDVSNPASPVLTQTLPAGVAPEGVLALPQRNLLIAASEKDDRTDKMRSVLNIYELTKTKAPAYPTLKSANDASGKPIAWGAMSGLAVKGDTLYSINDSFYGQNSVFEISTATQPAVITKAMRITDANGKLANHSDEAIRKRVNDDKTVNIDPEGIAVSADGGFWVASEGSGTVGAEKKPYKFPNLILKTDANANVTDVVTLPAELTAVQLRFGLEGIAEDNGKLYVAFQRAWNKEANPRIGMYDINAKTWSFVYYPLDKPESQRGGWVGLSDISSLGNGKFAVLERDNQGGPDAAIKRIYEIDLSKAKDGETITKALKSDLLKEGKLTETGNLPFEKVEGLAVDKAGNAWIINDNDGVDDNSGETLLKKVGGLF